MRGGVCPKCGSEDVYASTNLSVKTNAHGMNAIPIRGGLYFSPSTAALENYVCVQCGYVESYIFDPRKLEEIVSRWAKVEREQPESSK